MHSRPTSLRRPIAAATGITLLASSLALAGLAPASANPAGTGLVISEVYGGGGNTGATLTNDFIELYNPTAAAISVNGLSVQWRSATGTAAATGVTALTGSVPAGEHYLVQEAQGNGGTTPLPTPEATGTIAMGGSNGTAILATGTTAINPGTGAFAGNAAVLDLVGVASNVFEGAVGPGMSNTTSVARNAAGLDSDSNAADFTAAAPTPQNSGTVAPGPLEATSPGNKTGQVGASVTGFTLDATGGTAPYTWTATGLPAGVTVAPNGAVSGTPTTAGTYNVTVTATDSAGTPATDDVTFTYTITQAAALIPIAEIQGTGTTTPLAGQSVATQGVVTAVYPTGGLNGFNVQTAGTGGATDATDATAGASDGIFVYGGPSGFATYPEVGDSVKVTGTAAEFASSGASVTQLTNATVTELTTPLAPATALTGPWFTTDGEREAHEGELFDPTGDLTVTNSYATWQYGEIGLATGTTPLVAPTEVRDAQTGNPGEIAADNARRLVTLDDGKSQNFGGSASGTPLSWLDATHTVRVGASATLKGAFVVDHRNGLYKLQPTAPVDGLGTNVAEFENTRLENEAPADVGGELRLATFNVLNYFPTTGVDYVAGGLGTCTYYNDRVGNPVTNNSCTNNGPRGAAEAEDFQRQQAKIVTAINKLDASIVTLEEIENSVQFGKDRDDAVAKLVTALNAAAGAGTWDYVRSPAPADRPAPAQEDVIRTAFIFKPAAVAPVGASQILIDEVNFDNAREPLAQAFKAAGSPDAEAFAVIVNHFKSKGSGADDGTGQGLANADRVGQAQALDTFADQFATARDVEAVFLTGDFNAYSKEDPVQVLEAAGYAQLESTDDPTEESYSFQGLSGSLDHVFANEAAEALVTGVDIWRINADESVGYQYSRFNYNATNLYTADQFNASDHNPEIVGLAFDEAPVDLQLLNINDFHGRIDANTTKFATTVEKLRAEQPDSTLFISAGDNIGASLFASAVADDQPTIDVLNALGLKASAVGNHEFDRGFADLTDRVIPAADWSHLGANVYEKGTETPALEEFDIFTVEGLEVAVIGVVTESTPSVVSPDGVATLDFGDPVEAVNRVADELTDGNAGNGEADVIVAEYHEGAGAGIPDNSTLDDEVAEGGAFADIVNETSAEVDAIFTGHTHKQYAWDAPVPGEPGTTRPIIQTGSYGEFVGQVVLELDPATGDVMSYKQANVARAATQDLSYPRVAEVKTIVDAAVAKAAVVGNQPIGEITDDITSAFVGGTYGPDGYTGGTRDDRAAESTLGGLVANALRDGAAEFAEPDLAVTNSGGLRAELLFAGNTTDNPANADGVVTFAEANAVLPFNNTVAIVEMTGANLKAVLEQQWQTNPDGTVPSRPYAQLGMSDNVEVIADESKPAGQRILSVRINDELLDPAQTYTVSTLSFLAAGGDNFRAFRDADYTDTGLLDAQLWRDYLAANKPLSPDFARQQVFAKGLPTELVAGQAATFQLGLPVNDGVAPITGTTLDLTSLGSPTNTEVVATLVNGGTRTVIDKTAVTNGVAAVELTVPAGTPTGALVELVAEQSGTRVTLPVTAGSATPPTTPVPTTPVPTTPVPTAPVPTAPVPTTPGAPDKVEPKLKPIKASGKVGRKVKFKVKIKADDELATGWLEVRVKGTKKVFRVKVRNGQAFVKLRPFAEAGTKKVIVKYLGNGDVASEKSTIKVKIRR